uniref:NTR domain-containing protein n=1 Tax=Plectus sambesii TaxID=2011161 RepID=A0A914VZS6_9BILA
MAATLSTILFALLVPSVLCCSFMYSKNNTERICQADFVGTVLLKSRRNDSDNWRYQYQGEIGAVFRANFNIPSRNNKTTVETFQHSATCGMPLTVRQDTKANMFFMATSRSENALFISITNSLICRWRDIGENFQRKLSRNYVTRACRCKRNDRACISAYNFDFLACTNVDWDSETKIYPISSNTRAPSNRRPPQA